MESLNVLSALWCHQKAFRLFSRGFILWDAGHQSKLSSDKAALYFLLKYFPIWVSRGRLDHDLKWWSCFEFCVVCSFVWVFGCVLLVLGCFSPLLVLQRNFRCRITANFLGARTLTRTSNIVTLLVEIVRAGKTGLSDCPFISWAWSIAVGHLKCCKKTQKLKWYIPSVC